LLGTLFIGLLGVSAFVADTKPHSTDKTSV
jgi:hypothetical protein